MCAICLCADRFGLGSAHDAICFACHMFMHFPCICISFHIFLLVNCFGTFLIVSFSLPLFLFTLVVSMASKRKSTPARNLLRSETSSSSDLLLSLSSVPWWWCLQGILGELFYMRFIRNAKSFWRTSLTLTFPLSFTIGNGSLCMTFQSLVLSYLSRSFTPTCTGLIVQYLFSSLAFEVRAFLSYRNLLWMCFMSLG